jgi:hypothetical protein
MNRLPSEFAAFRAHDRGLFRLGFGYRCLQKVLWLPSPPTCWGRRAGDEGAGSYAGGSSSVPLHCEPPHPRPLSPKSSCKHNLHDDSMERGAWLELFRHTCATQREVNSLPMRESDVGVRYLQHFTLHKHGEG